jgi:sugar lactone lactonase YvrE
MVTTLAGTAGVRGSIDGTGAAARFAYPTGVAADSAGNVYVADSDNSTIRKITPGGVVTTLAGTAGLTGSTDGTGAAARFDSPNGVATDSAGNVYVSEWGNNTIRKITPAGIVSTLAGTAGVRGSVDGTGAAARFSLLRGVAVDSAGNVYVADDTTIRKITRAGVVTTLAGTAGVRGSTDGTGAAARFNPPNGVATDGAGNVYVCEWGNNTIRKITPAGVVTTLAGTAGVAGSTDGTGAAARFRFPIAVTTDSTGNVYVADWGNSTIRKITPAGMVSTVVGVAGQASFVPSALPGRIAFPVGVAVSGTSLYITLHNGVAVVQNRP